MHAETFSSLLPSAIAICMMESSFIAESFLKSIHYVNVGRKQRRREKENTSKIIYSNFKSSVFTVCVCKREMIRWDGNEKVSRSVSVLDFS